MNTRSKRTAPKQFYEDINDQNLTYDELLNTLDWEIRRYQIFKRDNMKCQGCGTLHDIVVHHIKYIKGLLPWEYKDDDLLTLCEYCHAKVHGKKCITSKIPKTWFYDPIAAKKYNIK